MLENYGIQQINSITIRATSPVIIGKNNFDKGETILFLSDIESAKIVEENTSHMASGGFQDPRLIGWIDHNGIKVTVERGVLSKKDFNFLLDSNIIKKENIPVSRREYGIVNSEGKVKLQYEPHQFFYCYNEYGDKIKNVEREGKVLNVGSDYIGTEITIDYDIVVENGYNFSMGRDFLSNIVVEVIVEFNLKSEEDGEEYTGILHIPSANIVGGMNIVLGKNFSPIVGNFLIFDVKNKVRNKENYQTYTITILNKDLSIAL